MAAAFSAGSRSIVASLRRVSSHLGVFGDRFAYQRGGAIEVA